MDILIHAEIPKSGERNSFQKIIYSNVNINRILKLPSRLEILSRKKRKSTRNLRDLYMIDFKKLSNVNINRVLKLPSRLEILSRKKKKIYEKSTRSVHDRSRRRNREASPSDAGRRNAMGSRKEQGEGQAKIRAKRRFGYISLSDNWRISVARSRDNEGLERGLDVPTGAFCSSSLLFTHP